MRTLTKLDLELGLVKLTEEQEAVIRAKVVPVLAQIAVRIIRDEQTAKGPAVRDARSAQVGLTSAAGQSR